jgi:hypothetical protein
VWAPAAPSPEPLPPRASATADQTAPIVEDMAAQIDRLRERVDAPPSFPPPERNPFRFGARPEPIPTKAGATAPEVVEPSAPPPPVLPKLLAIAANDVDGVTVLTAVLSVNNAVRIVKVGDTVGNFIVHAISASVIELVESSSGATFQLTLS